MADEPQRVRQDSPDLAITEGDGIVARAFGSEHRRRAVAAFATKEQVEWQGR